MPRFEVCSDDEGEIDEPENVRWQHRTIALPPGVTVDLYSGIRNSPPPGLVRAKTPQAIRYSKYKEELAGNVRTLTNEDVSIFGDFAKYIEPGVDSAGRQIELDLTCSISHASLDVYTRNSKPRDPNDAARAEPMAVLPCGHFFGYRGIDDWIRTRIVDEMPPDCPICRFFLTYPQCGHEIKIRPYDARFQRDGQLPLTIPEGGTVPKYCLRCRFDYIRAVSQQLAYEIYPDNIPSRAFINPRACGPDEFEDKRMKMQDRLLETMFIAEAEYSHW
ncbi:hypothetical protein Daesc_009903 [Daldinia eschscholtzii]|uniref:RING-type domain-containing protein n=1 Tax=Daldinia eschscholtzii TaxID=292717 RepID=A0AAX6M6I0_9PEZI